MKKILSLFDHSGQWSKPYRDAGYEVIQIDIKEGTNVTVMSVLDIDEDWVRENGPFHGILAAPPCTDFSVSGAQYWPRKDADGTTEAALALVRKVLEIVEWAQPAWWVFENPVGRLPRLLPEVGRPWYFQPHWYGDAYTKKTGLWGNFTRPDAEHAGDAWNPVEPIRYCKQGSWLQQLGGKSERTKELRSVTPPGFARAFFNANR